MRLSEAIRLGAMLHPQTFLAFKVYRRADGTLTRYDPSGEIVGTCALGAADVAGYPAVFESQTGHCTAVQCPACGLSHFLSNVIAHLNDEHRWTREAIADWVETVERANLDAATSTVADAQHRSVDAVDPVPQVVAEGLRA